MLHAIGYVLFSFVQFTAIVTSGLTVEHIIDNELFRECSGTLWNFMELWNFTFARKVPELNGTL